MEAVIVPQSLRVSRLHDHSIATAYQPHDTSMGKKSYWANSLHITRVDFLPLKETSTLLVNIYPDLLCGSLTNLFTCLLQNKSQTPSKKLTAHFSQFHDLIFLRVIQYRSKQMQSYCSFAFSLNSFQTHHLSGKQSR